MMLLSVILYLLLSLEVRAEWSCNCQDAVMGCNLYDFGANMVQAIEERAKGNMLVSPAGLWIVLFFAYTGAVGDTKTRLRSALFPHFSHHCEAQTVKDIFGSFWRSTGKCINERTGPYYIHLSTTRSKNICLTDSYAATLRGNSSFQYVKYMDPEYTVKEYIQRTLILGVFHQMNTFLRRTDVTKDTRYMILSQVKYNVTWKIPIKGTHEFEENGRKFTKLYTSGDFTTGYDRLRDTSYLYLEFSNAPDLLMVIALTDSIEHAHKTSWDMFDPRNKEVRYQQVAIPKFRFQVEYSLKQVMDRLNCGILFGKDCNLEGVDGERHPVSQVIQRTFVRIDENGVGFEGHTILINDPSGWTRDQESENTHQRAYEFYLFASRSLIAQGRINDPTY